MSINHNGFLAPTSLLSPRPNFTIVCWISSTSPLKFKGDKNKLIFFIEYAVPLSNLPWGNGTNLKPLFTPGSLDSILFFFHPLQPLIDKLIIKLGQICPSFPLRFLFFGLTPTPSCMSIATLYLVSGCPVPPLPSYTTTTVFLRVSQGSPLLSAAQCREKNRGLAFRPGLNSGLKPLTM